MKRIPEINNLLKDNELSTKVYFYFTGTKVAGDDFDPWEKRYTYTNLNPIVVKMNVREIDSESLVWRQMGIQEIGAKEILCEDKYANYFRLANKIEIDSDTYEVYKTAGRLSIQKRPYHLIRVIVRKQ